MLFLHLSKNLVQWTRLYKNERNKKMKKITSDTKKVFVAGLICLILALLSVGIHKIVSHLEEKDKRQTKEFNQLVAEQDDEENVSVGVTITREPILIASRSDSSVEEKYYILVDNNEYTYLAKLSN